MDKKRQYTRSLLALILTLVMLISAFPISVFAAEEVAEQTTVETDVVDEVREADAVATEPQEESPQEAVDALQSSPISTRALPTSDTNDYLKLHKSVSYKGADDYLLTLEAYLTGLKREIKQPLDIVLTIDLTGSMHQEMVTADSYIPMYNYNTTSVADATSANPRAYVNYSAATGGPYAVLRKYTKTDGKWTYADTNMAPNNSYAVKSGNTFIPVTVKNGSWTDANGKTYSPKSSPTSGGTQIYTKGKVTRMDAMINAIIKFIELIEQDAIQNNLAHRIALVSFQEYEFASYPFYTGLWNGSTMYGYVGGTDPAGKSITKVATSHYQSAFKVVTSGKTSFLQSLGEMMKAPYYSRGTFPLSGIQMTNNVFRYGSTTGNPRVNVFFSDGEPNRGPDNGYYWDKDVFGAGSLEAIKTTKNTYNAPVFVVGIFDGANDQSLGSNASTSGSAYANYFLQRISSNYNGSGNPDPSKGYYVSATTSDALGNAFQKVLNRLVTSGGANLELTGGAKLKDVISENFKLPDGITPADVKVYTADYTADNTFGARQVFTDATVNIDTNSKTVEVTNFDYGANWCGQVLDHLDQVTRYNGKKIIVEIPIVATGKGNGLATNETTSAVAEGSFIDSFAVPSADIPVDVQFSKTAYNSADKSKSFTFEVEYTTFMNAANNQNYEYNNDNGSNGNYLSGKTRTESMTFTMSTAAGYAIQNLYSGSILKFKEQVDDTYQQIVSYTTSSNTNPVVLTPDGNGYYQITVGNEDVRINVRNIRKGISLPINKVYIGVPGSAAATFRFKVELQEGSSWKELNTTSYPRLVAQPSVTLSPTGSTSVVADIRFAPDDVSSKTLRITEIPVDGILCDTSQFLIDVKFDANGEPALYAHGSGKPPMVEFENTQLIPVELKKRITGNAADVSNYFRFKVSVTLSDGTAGTYKVASLTGGAMENNGYFELYNNSVVNLLVPYGAKVAVEETSTEPYTTVITVNGKKEGSHDGDSVLKTELVVTGTNNTILYENRYQILIDTGVVLDSLPYILILLGVAVGAALLFGKRRDHEDT